MQLIFNKSARTIKWGKKSFQQMVPGQVDILLHVAKKELGVGVGEIGKGD